MTTIQFRDGYIMIFADAIKGEFFARSVDKKDVAVIAHANGVIEHF